MLKSLNNNVQCQKWVLKTLAIGFTSAYVYCIDHAICSYSTFIEFFCCVAHTKDHLH